MSLGHPRSTTSAHWEFAKNFFAITHRDIVFVLAIAAFAKLLLWITRKHPRLRLGVFWTFAGFSAVCVVYAVVGVRVFSYLKSPLTYPLIYVAGDFKNMKSSLGVFVSGRLILCLVLAPVLYLSLSWYTQRKIGVPPGRWMRLAAGAGLLLLVAQGLFAHHVYQVAWRTRAEHRIFDNPQWTLASSCVKEWIGLGVVHLHGGYPRAYWNDFDPLRASREAAAAQASAVAHHLATAPASAPAAVAQAVPPPQTRPAVRPPKNVIMLVLESTSVQHMSLYGSPFKTTPHLDAEASHALVFDNVYAHVGMTASSLFGITLSNYPGITYRQYTLERPDMPGVSLAQLLKERGYRTAFITSADIDFSGQDKFLSGRGFDRVSDWRTLPGPKLFSWGSSDSALVDSMLQWVDRQDDRPFFLVGWTTQTHHPYQMSPGQKELDLCHGRLPVEGDGLNLYLNCMHEDDEQIGRLLDGLRGRGLDDDTLVVITGDHGEAFNWPHDTAGHGSACYEECLHVPCVFWNPRLFDHVKRDPTVGGHIDLNPTIAGLLGLQAPDKWQGRSLLDPTRPPRTYFFAANHDYLLGLREGNLKYIYNATVGSDELYDLTSDPLEQNSLAETMPQKCVAFRQRVAAWLEFEQQRQAIPTQPTAPDAEAQR